MNYKTIGYEVEFNILPEHLENYSKLYINPNKDNYGFDSLNLDIAEYRSNVFSKKEDLLNDYIIFKNNISVFNPIFIPNIDKETYGIHLSFNKYNKLKLLYLYLIIYFLNHPIICIKRMIKIEWFRKHVNRIEFRLIPTLNNDKLFLKFINRL